MIFIFIASNDTSSGEKSGFLANLVLNFLGFITNKNLSYFNIELINFVIRKFAHISEYFLLMLSNYYFFSNIIKNKNIRIILLYSLLFTLAYSISDEFHQSFISTRVGTYHDVLIDSVGILIAYFIIFEYKYIKQIKNNKLGNKIK